MSRGVDYAKLSETGISRAEKTTFEVFSCVLGAFAEMLQIDFAVYEASTDAIHNLGKSIGSRIADEVISKVGLVGACASFSEACDIIVKLGLRLYLGFSADSSLPSKDGLVYTLKFVDANVFECVDASGGRTAGLSILLQGCLVGALSQLGWNVTI